MCKERFNNTKGITLIALIITIVVMLILVAVTINIAINGGIFSYAGKAAQDTKKSIQDEQGIARGIINGKTIDEYVNGDSGGETLYDLYEAGTLKIGDFVNYTPTSDSYSVAARDSGQLDSQDFSTQDFTWRVLNVDENTTLLISSAPTNTSIEFKGHVGYENYEDVLNNTCRALYSNAELEAEARSINIQDINNLVGNSAINQYKYLCELGEETVALNGIYKPGNWVNTNNGVSVTSSDKYEIPLTKIELKDIADALIEESIELATEPELIEDLLLGDPEVLAAQSNYRIISGGYGGTYMYFVASKSATVNSSKVTWYGIVVGMGYMHNAYEKLCQSDGSEYSSQSLYLRPVVAIPSNTSTSKVNKVDNGTITEWRPAV